jgi:hypothetical protein
MLCESIDYSLKAHKRRKHGDGMARKSGGVVESSDAIDKVQ